MPSFVSKLAPRSAVVVLLMLTAGAVLAFAAVSHLVTRYNENQKARGRRLYAQGMADLSSGSARQAIEELRAALICDRANPQYQLSLARALRDNGSLEEAQSYLLSLWEKTPEDGTINLALARVAARRASIDDALRYYHNAMYGVWPSDPDVNRRNARMELIEFLLRENALAQARAEIVALAAFLPPDPPLRVHTADLFYEAQDYPDALAEYERVLKMDRSNPAALAGAGKAAYQIGRYRTAERDLQSALAANSNDSAIYDMRAMASLILQTDPFVRLTSDSERNRRIAAAFDEAGERLHSCAPQKGVDLSQVKPEVSPTSTLSSTSPLVALESRWLATKPQLRRLRSSQETDLPDVIMDLVFDIEQQTSALCGQPQGVDKALLLISADPENADQ